MNQGSYVFSQIMEPVARYQFNECVARYHGDYWVKRFSCWDHFLALTFGQLAFRESLRDIVICLTAQRNKLYHLGFRSVVARNTLAHASEKRDWRMYRDYALLLIDEARRLYVDESSFADTIGAAVYVIDASIIELCMGLFPWSRFREYHAGIKLNVAMDLRGSLPVFFHISRWNTPDLAFLDHITYEPGSYYVMDRGYVDFRRMYAIQRAGAFFVNRARRDLRFRRIYSRTIDKTTGVRCDQVIVFTGHYARKDYPEKLRRVKYVDQDTGRRYVFLTNNFTHDAHVIAELYRHRWQIELFFKWIKQHLCIKAFWGRSMNAVKVQICIAICAYLLVAITKKRLGITRNTYEILQILSVSLFDKTPLYQLISEFQLQNFSLDQQTNQKQPSLWDY